MSVLATYTPDEVYTTTRNQMLPCERPIAWIVQWWPDQSNLIGVHCFVLVSTDLYSSCMDLHLSILTKRVILPIILLLSIFSDDH